MKNLIFVFAVALMGHLAFANCSDEMCKVSANGKSISFDLSVCGLASHPSVTIETPKGERVSLPSNKSFLAGYWITAEDSEAKVRFVDDGGAEVFRLELMNTADGSVGTLTADINGVKVNNAAVTCN